MIKFLRKMADISLLSKLLGLASLGSSIGSSIAHMSILHRFLEGIIGIIALIILSAMMAGMLIVSCFYGLYVGLTAYGLTPDAALVTIVVLATLITALLAWLTFDRLRQIHALPDFEAPRGISQISNFVNISHAFIEGFKTRRPTSIRH